MELTTELSFKARHAVKVDGKREEPHWHEFKIRVTVEGDLKENGFVVDFVKLREVIRKLIICELEGGNLNEIFDQPSVELIGVWIFRKLKEEVEKLGCTLASVSVFERETDWITVRESDI